MKKDVEGGFKRFDAHMNAAVGYLQVELIVDARECAVKAKDVLEGLNGSGFEYRIRTARLMDLGAQISMAGANLDEAEEKFKRCITILNTVS
jgi:hypothetical protein